MKSQPEMTIRRIAVFTGYEESALGMAFTRPIRRPDRTPAVLAQLDHRRPAEPEGEAAVIRLEAVPAAPAAEMWRAA